MQVAVVTGNPKVGSRTLDAAIVLASRLAGRAPDHVVDVATLGPGLLGWGDPAVEVAVDTVASSDLVVVASPTFKATYSGILKVFLDQFATGSGLAGVVAVPLMLGAGPAHALAPELLLRPVLVELGATVVAPGTYLQESRYDDPSAFDTYVARWAPSVLALADSAVRA
ncbi:NAD(P)H-dependent oxidoreductase [Mumia sp. ZJ1417]|uniref:NADPH-dependent FMN reductase n=1 Tax=Mumia sp. ZJ1417 TaxID=2708082 RepID=UPI001422DC24|nr:NAD(P)H-dependent oxidoreductase [Mumia sp. ZJ1417]QMW64847.1 NAD(P)H-dependent oxidoreductase [Mumia sp. ZJ1417]